MLTPVNVLVVWHCDISEMYAARSNSVSNFSGID